MTRIVEDTKLDYTDVLLVPKEGLLNSRTEVTLGNYDLGHFGIPIIAANMDGVGTFTMAEALAKHDMFTALHKHYSVEDLVRFFTDKANADIIPYTIYSMGATDNDLAKFEAVQDAITAVDGDLHAQSAPYVVCVDVANGYTPKFAEFLRDFKLTNPTTTLIAGNVCTPERTVQLITLGVDLVKIGIGPGSVCTTRIQAGVGYPQLSAVLECAEAAHQAGGGVIADGGCTCPGDVVKAFAAGANAVMLGGMFAGHDEGYEGRHQNGNHSKNRTFYGMASKTAQDIHNGGVKDYRSSEGREVTVPYRGQVENTILNLLGGIRSGLSYVGAEDLISLSSVSKFVKVNNQYNKVFV